MMEKVVSEYLACLNIPISKKYCQQCMVSHPNYPSLLSVADTLERLGIKHQIARIKEEQLPDFPFPYMLQFDKQGGTLALIKDQKDLDDHKDDMEYWDGVVVMVEPTQTIADEEHNKQYGQEKLQRNYAATAILALLALLCLFIIPYGSWLYGLLAVTSVGGIVVGYLLLAKDLGVTYEPVEEFCNAGKRTNCDRILHAKDAQLFSFFTFTDATASYFVFQLIAIGLLIPLFKGSASFLVPLAAASLLAIPIIVYSLYYQYTVASTWCRLCLIVDGILGVQVALFATMMYSRKMFAWGAGRAVPICIMVLLFFVIASLVVLLKNRLKATNEASRDATAAKRVKHDPQVFAHLLLQEEKMNTTLFEPEMLIGNSYAPIRVTMIINLHCNPCRIAYETVTQLLSAYPQKVAFAVRLTKGMNKAMGELSASTYFIRYWQTYIIGKKNISFHTQKLLKDWYDQMDPETFMNQYPLDGEPLPEPDNSESLEAQHYRWIQQNNIIGTPAFFINGYKMPENYRIQDLQALLPGLVSLVQAQRSQTEKI
jgi:protein-disulfide isomerase